MAQSFFSKDYVQARQRFRQAIGSIGGQLSSYPVHNDELTIDVGILGQQDANNAVLVSSGLHGVEGFLGSAIQLAWLDHVSTMDRLDQRVVLIHALNPFGFANVRRWNEANIDLNRNCFSQSDPRAYQGTPSSYHNLNGLLNPASPLGGWEFFQAKAIWKIVRMGLPAIKQAVASGQYDYPKGLFFGGHERGLSIQIVSEQIRSWIGPAGHVVHLDLHTGLGKSSECVLMLEDDSVDAWFTHQFPGETIEGKSMGDGTGYTSSGSLGCWLQSKLADLNYRFALAEYGTHPVLRVVAALRAENRLHFYGTRRGASKDVIKAELLECFCPASEQWRSKVTDHGVNLVERARGSAHQPALSR